MCVCGGGVACVVAVVRVCVCGCGCVWLWPCALGSCVVLAANSWPLCACAWPRADIVCATAGPV